MLLLNVCRTDGEGPASGDVMVGSGSNYPFSMMAIRVFSRDEGYVELQVAAGGER